MKRLQDLDPGRKLQKVRKSRAILSLPITGEQENKRSPKTPTPNQTLYIPTTAHAHVLTMTPAEAKSQYRAEILRLESMAKYNDNVLKRFTEHFNYLQKFETVAKSYEATLIQVQLQSLVGVITRQTQLGEILNQKIVYWKDELFNLNLRESLKKFDEQKKVEHNTSSAI